MSIRFRRRAKACLVALSFLALVGLGSGTARAGTTLNTSYDHQHENGYEALAADNPYSVFSPATFNNNGRDGLSENNGAIATVYGGSFSNNAASGLTLQGQTETKVTILGGTFTGNNYGVYNNSDGDAAVYGGTFSGNL